MPDSVSVTIQKSSDAGKLEESDILAVKDHDGCCDISDLSDTIW
jgi:hypothetical protein